MLLSIYSHHPSANVLDFFVLSLKSSRSHDQSIQSCFASRSGRQCVVALCLHQSSLGPLTTSYKYIGTMLESRSPYNFFFEHPLVRNRSQSATIFDIYNTMPQQFKDLFQSELRQEQADLQADVQTATHEPITSSDYGPHYRLCESLNRLNDEVERRDVTPPPARNARTGMDLAFSFLRIHQV